MYMAAGGVVVAGELWMPGTKLISIPRVQAIGRKPLSIMLTHLGQTTYRWTEMCTVVNGVWDAPDRVLLPTKPLALDSIKVKSPYAMGPKIVDLGVRPLMFFVEPGNSLTIQWSSSGIMTES